MYKGINASDGVGIGVARVAVEPDLSFTPHVPDDLGVEKERYEAAVAKFVEQTNAQIERMTATMGAETAAIMQAHNDFAEDEGIKEMVISSIESGMCAEQAVSEAYGTYYTMFSQMDDELFRERAADVADVKTGLLADLLGKEVINLSDLPERSIVVVHELTPSMTADMDREHVVAIITETGGRTSHSAIIARTLEIPAVLSVPNICTEVKTGDLLVVDGTKGVVIPDPSDTDIEHYRLKAKQLLEWKAKLQEYRGKETVTADGRKVLLVANIGNSDGAYNAIEHDAEGIGLFRSEFLFMDAKAYPSEDDQFAAYQKVALRMKDKPVIIRTLDVGGDKEIPYLGLVKEENPFMGYRAVRYCLANPEQFRIQLTALLRASAFGDIKIMIPMITTVDELRQAKALVEECKADLDARGIAYDKDIEVGVMMETPAAAFIADDLAEEASFFSIGTNDLTGYTMCADRGNDKVAYLYETYQPAVLRALKNIIEAGVSKGIMVGMCGESAADPLLTPLFISWGLEEYSVSSPSILATRRQIAHWTKAEADELAEKVMQLKTVTEVKSMLQAAVK